MMNILFRKGSLAPPLSLLWLGFKVTLYLILAMISTDLVVVAYQQF